MSEMTETIEDVRRRLEDGVLRITLNRPDAGNAMTVSMRNEIMDWLVDAGGAYLLTRLVGPQKAKELFFFGDDIPAAEAERIGLVNKVVPRAELDTTLGDWAGRLAKAPTKAIGFAKWLTNRSLETDRAGSFWDEAYAQELVSSTEDASEGMASFVERRPPEFKGW